MDSISQLELEFTLDKLEPGDKFRFLYEDKAVVRTLVQKGRFAAYCPRDDHETIGHEAGVEVYLLKDNRVVLIQKLKYNEQRDKTI